MLKFSLSFLAGALAVAVAVFMSQGHVAVLMFSLGALTVLVIAGALLSSAARIRKAARFLSAFAEALEPAAAPKAQKLAVMPAPAAADPEGVEAEVISALVNFKAPRKKAEAAARRAVEQNPGAGFDDTFRVALGFVKAA